MTSAGPMRKKGIPRQASSYRAARRNRVLRVEHGVWRGPNARYVPMAPLTIRRMLQQHQALNPSRGLDR